MPPLLKEYHINTNQKIEAVQSDITGILLGLIKDDRHAIVSYNISGPEHKLQVYCYESNANRRK